MTRETTAAAAGTEPTLVKPIEDWTEAERKLLADGDLETWAFLDGNHEAVKAVRARFLAGAKRFSRADIATCLNLAETVRVMGHWAFAIADRNRAAMGKRLSMALCAFCDWSFNEPFEVPEERALTPEEVSQAEARITTAIRDHITACPNHPMRVIERELGAWKEFADHLEHCVTCGQTGTGDCFDGGQLRKAAYEAEYATEGLADG